MASMQRSLSGHPWSVFNTWNSFAVGLLANQAFSSLLCSCNVNRTQKNDNVGVNLMDEDVGLTRSNFGQVISAIGSV
ncbi:Uncharacterized protein TCM_019863 [Theobroma cacao]|uniref:Uncharacterized protein n=1 Tax=Theobroma cacao TaxID=3641 RepID=A0A061EQU9_THECC|nr:Uncharacterized protein TCM_019863 [Theobroma cacao]